VLEHGESTTPDAQARLSGFLKACARKGICVRDEDVQVWSYDAHEMEAWWASKPRQTAIFAWNEGVAGNILKQAARLGIEVPRQLSVVGFDSTAYCETTTPKLTAVRQPISAMANAAAEYLFRLLEGEETQTEDLVFACSLDERESLSVSPKLVGETLAVEEKT
ncbi:MAG: substrate-binding domain-containing protein, partial [Armatimonadota bacterium]